MIPPNRIEQLNNFQDAVQSPDGLDRLRALQHLEQVLPSSKGLMGMPQVQAPAPQMQPQVPVMSRQYGGEIGTGGLVGLTSDGIQIFDNSQEGALNRATHGGVLEGYNYTPSIGGTATAGEPVIQLNDPMGNAPGTTASTPVATHSLDAPGTLAAGGSSDYSHLNIPETIKAVNRPQTPYRTAPSKDYYGRDIPGTEKIPSDLYVYQQPTDYAQGFDMKDVPYLTANKMAQDAGADRFIYNQQWARTEALPDDYDYGIHGTQVWNEVARDMPGVAYNQSGTRGGQVPYAASINPDSPQARRAMGQSLDYYGRWVYGTVGAGATPVGRAYGGEVGTGGLVGLTDDGTQIFDNSQEGALNRAIHGGVYEGYNYTPSTGGTATATAPVSVDSTPAVATSSLDAPGTLAAGGSDSSYGARLPTSAIADTNLYNLPSVQAKGGIYNAGDVRDSGMSLTRPADAPETIATPQTQTPYRDPYTGKIPYDLWHAPVVNDFGQGYDLKNMDYFTANALALKEGATRFKYNDEYARVDPGLLSDYDYSNLGTKPYSYIDDQASYNTGTVQMDARHSGITPNPRSASAMRAQGLYPGLHGGWGDIHTVVKLNLRVNLDAEIEGNEEDALKFKKDVEEKIQSVIDDYKAEATWRLD